MKMDVRASPHVVGRYAIYGKIASGGMASVHFGRLLGGAGFARTVAIKRLHPHLAEDPDFLTTMIDEARLAARIHHPNVVPTLDVVATDGELLLVMEYVRGESLSRVQRSESAAGRRVPLAIANAIVVGALHGLHSAHEATSDQGEPLGIVHRDVSPHNILIGVDGVARVIDFGVAKAAGRLQTTREGTIKGKIAYMAPEQLAGHVVTRSADIYAMGVVLWEMLAGKRLFHAEAEPALVGLVMAGAKLPPSKYAPELAPGLDDVVMKALSREPAQRFATARAMADALMRVLAPAFPTEVGEWCAEVARDALAKRAALLGEIESSGVAPAVPRSTDGIGIQYQASPAGFAPAARGTAPDDAPPTIGSQASSLSLETPKQTRTATLQSRRFVLVGSAGAAAALLVVAAVMTLRPSLSATPIAASGGAAPPPAVSSPTTAATHEITATPPAAAVPTSMPTAFPTTTTPAPTPPKPVATGHAVATQPAKPKTSCTPPYEFDAQGKKIWKRECL
jgi:eukaryotic-like serine/threonine-protein kinase